MKVDARNRKPNIKMLAIFSTVIIFAGLLLRAAIVKPDIVLSLAIESNSNPTKLVYTITNKGNGDFETTPLATNTNYLVIVKPDGKILELGAMVDGVAPIIITPGNTYQNEFNALSNMFDHYLSDSGFYTIYFKINNIKSNSIRMYYSSPEKPKRD